MTFPRRLTPSDKERQTIVQQRMAPGGALGVGSRHVRQLGDKAQSASFSTGGSPIGWAQFEDPRADIAYGSGGIRPSSLVDSGGEDSFEYDGGFGIRFTDGGWYQVSPYVQISSLNAGDVIRVSAIFGALPFEPQGYAIAAGAGVAYATTSTPPYFAAAGTVIEMAVDNVNVTTGTSVKDAAGLYLVRLA